MLCCSKWTSTADIIEEEYKSVIMNWILLLQPQKDYSSKEGLFKMRKNCETKGIISILLSMSI